MMDLRLIVINDITGFEFSTKVSFDDLPDNVILINAVYDDDFPLPEGKAALLVTDNAAHAERFAGQERYYTVFVGSAESCEGFADRLRDIWNASDGAELLHRRLVRTVKDIKSGYDAHFYKNALLTTVNSVPDMLWFRRLDGVHTLVNDRLCEVVRKERSDIIGKDHLYIWDVSDAEESENSSADESEEIAVSTGKTYICDEPVRTSEGLKQFTTYKTPIYDMFGNIFGTVGIGHDVTNFSNMGIELALLVENLPFPLVIFNADWKVVRMNGMFSEYTGAVSEAQRNGFDYMAWKHETLVPVTDREEDKERNFARREYKMELRGESRSMIVTELEIRDFFDNISGYIVTMVDITYERAYEQSILEAANTDMLTGLFNRRYFYSFLGEMKGRPITLIYMDLDRFKAINDSFGHASGDEVLIRTADIMRSYFPDSVCTRLGGDEFAVIDDKLPEEEIRDRCAKLEKTVREEFLHYGTGTTISIGISFTNGESDDIDELFQSSDEKMYAIKKQHHDKSSEN